MGTGKDQMTDKANDNAPRKLTKKERLEREPPFNNRDRTYCVVFPTPSSTIVAA